MTYDEIAERANAKLKAKAISSDTIRNLHLMRGSGGRQPNPTVNTLDTIAVAFGIEDGVRYFTGSDDEADAIRRQLDAVHALAALSSGNTALSSLLARAASLPSGSLNLVVDLAERLHAIEEQHSPPRRDPTL
ncbi:hypothetical protein [Kitasatospora griseola]